MEEWLRPKKREINKKKPQEEIDAEALAHPTPMNLELRKAAKQRLREKAEATLAMIGGGGDETDGTAGTATDGAATDGTTTSLKGKPKKAVTNGTKPKPSRAKAKKPPVKEEPESDLEEAAVSSDSDAGTPPLSEEDVKPAKPTAAPARSGRSRAAAGKNVSYAEAEGSPVAESDVDMQ